jgi:hypothetical protein
MAIQGLQKSEAVPVLNNDDVGAAVEALSLITNFDDRAQVEESVRRDFAGVRESGVKGEAYIQVPGSVANLGRVVQALDEGNFSKDYPSTYVWHELWTPSTGPEGYAQEELDEIDGLPTGWQAHGRIAVHGTESQDEPLLHFLGLPYDDYAKQTWDPKAEATQLEKVAKAKQAFEAEHPDFNMVVLDANAVGFIGLMRRIKGEPMPMSWGFMRDASLPRKTVGGDSVVGCVDSLGGQLGFSNSLGYGNGYVGVGLSVGLKEV